MQPDSQIPDYTNPQAWNRYSYVTNRPINLNDPTGHSYNPPCIFCNIQWFDYSNTPLFLQGVLDFATVGACLFLMCNPDPNTHTVWGPTREQSTSSMFIPPVADVVFPTVNIPRLLYTSADEVVSERASQLQSALGSRSRSVTMAAAVVEDKNSTRMLVLSSSEPNGYIRKEVNSLILPDEQVLKLPGHQHAEINIITWAEKNGLKLINMAAGNNFCPSCRPVLEDIFKEVAKKLAR